MLRPSPKAIAFVQKYEQCRLAAYFATDYEKSIGKASCGWGSTGPDITIKTRWTQEQADFRFANDCAEFGARVADLLRSPTTQNQYDALFSLAYNVGWPALSGSTLLRIHNAGFYDSARQHFVDWDHQDHVEVEGLKKRRLAEAEMYSCPSQMSLPLA